MADWLIFFLFFSFLLVDIDRVFDMISRRDLLRT